MKLKEGQKIKLVTIDFHRRKEEHIGKVEKIYPSFILLDLKNYKESISKSDILNPRNYNLKIRNKKCWIDVTEDMLEDR